MSAGAYLVIRCDHRPPGGEQCDRERGWPVYVRNHTELRRNLKTQDWRRTRKGKDLCPDHSGRPTPSDPNTP
jgi:hypothetical protein